MGKCSDQTVYLRNLRAEPLEIADLRLECVNGFMKPDTQLDIVAKPMYRFHLKPAANVVVPPKSEVGIRVTVRTVDKVTKRFEEFMEIRLRTGELFSYSVIIDPGVAFAKTKKHATPQPVLVVQAQAPQALSSTTAPAGGPRASSSRSRSPTTSRLHAADERDLELLRDLESSNNMLRQQLRKKRATDATNAYMQCLEEVERDLDALRLETSPREEGGASNEDGASRRQHETVGAVDGFSWVRRVESALNQNKYNAALNRPPVVRQKKNSSGGAGPKADERNLTATTQRKLIQKLQEESAILRQAVGGRIAQGSGPLRMKKRKRSASAGRGGAGGSKQAKPIKSRAGKPTAASAAGEIEDKLALHAQLLSLEAEVMELRADLLQQTSVEGLPELEQLMGAEEDHDQPMGGGHGGGHANATIKGSSMDYIVSSSTSAASSPNEAAAPADLVLTLPSSSSRGVSDSDGAKKEIPAFYGQTLIRPEESARKKRLQKEKRRAARAAKEGASATATGAGDSTLTDYFREGPAGGASSKSPVSASDESPTGGLGEVGASPRSGSSKLPFSPVGLTENDRREFAAIFDPPNASQSPKKMQRTRTVGVDIYVAAEAVVSASCPAQTSTSPLESLSPTGERIPMLLDEDRGASGQIEECRAAASHELVVFSTSQNRVADAGPTSEQQPKRGVFEAPASPSTAAAHAERGFNAASEDVEVVRPPAPVAGTGSDREDEPSSKPSSVVHHSPPSPRARGPQGGHSSSPSAAEADDEDDQHGIPSELSANHEELLREHRTARLKAAGGSAIIKWHEEQEATRPRPSSSRVLGAGGSGSGSDANEDIASAPASPKPSQAGPGPAPGASNAREQGEVTSIAANSNINTTIVRAEASGDHDELEGMNDEQDEASLDEAAAAGKGEDSSANADDTTRAKTEPEAPEDNIHDKDNDVDVNLNVLASPSPRRGTSRSGGANQQEDHHVPPPGPCSTPGPVTHTPSNVHTPEEVVGLLDAAFVNVQQISAQMVASPDMQTVNDQLDYILVHEIQPLRMRLSNMEKAARDAMEEKVEAVFALLQTIQDQIAKSVLRRRDQVESAMDDAESKASAADLGSHRHGIQELLDVQPVLDRAAAVLAHYPVDSPGSAAISAPPALELDLAAPLQSNAHADSGASSADSLSVISEDPCDEPSMRVTRASIRRLIVRSLRVSGDPVHQIQMPRPALGSGATATALGSCKNARRRSNNILPLPQDSSAAAAEGGGAAPAPGVSSSGNESISSAKIASENMRILREEYHADSYPNTPARGSKDVPGSGKGFFGDEFEQSSSDAPEDPGAPPITRAGGATQFDADLFKCEMHERVRDLAQKALRKRLCYVSVGQLAERSKTLAESIESHTPDDLQGSIKCKKSHAPAGAGNAVDVTAATAEGRSSAVVAPVVHPICVPPGSQGEKTDAEPDTTLLTLSFGEQTILQQLLEKVLTAFVLQKQDFHKEAQQQNEGTSSLSRSQLLELDASSMAMARLVAEIEMILSDLFDRVLLSEERLLERSPKQKPSPDDFRAQVGGGAEALLRGGTGAKNFVAASAAGPTLPAKTEPPAEAGAATNEAFELPLFDELTVNPLYAVTSLLYSDPLLIHDGHPRHDIPNVFAAAHDATRSVELSVLSARSEDDARGLLVDAFVDDLIQEGVVHDQRTGAHQSQHLQYPGKNIGAARRTGSSSKAGSPHSPRQRASGNRSNIRGHKITASTTKNSSPRPSRASVAPRGRADSSDHVGRTSRRTGSSASAAVSATSSLGPAEVQEEEVFDAAQEQNLRLSSASASASSVRLTPLEGGASASRRSSSADDDPMVAPLVSPSSMMFQRNKNMFADMEMDASDGEEIVDEDIISEQVADDWANLGEDEEASLVDDEDDDDAAAVPFRAVDEPAQAPEYEENQGAAEENSASESGRDYRNNSRNSSTSSCSSSSSGSSQRGNMDTSYSRASRNQSADAEHAEEELLGRSSSASAATEGEHQIASSSAASSAGAEKMTSSRHSSKASGSGSGSGPPQPPARRTPSAASSASSSSSSSATPLSSACSRDLDAALAQFEELQSD